MLVNTSEEEWDAVVPVHLKGHFAPLRHAGTYWAGGVEGGRPRAARVINTSSGAGLEGSVGQATYPPPKAGIAGLTLVAAGERAATGSPWTRSPPWPAPHDRGRLRHLRDGGARGQLAVVAWLASEEARDVTGPVIRSTAARSPSRPAGGTVRAATPAPLAAADVGPALRDLLAEGPAPEPVYGAARPLQVHHGM